MINLPPFPHRFNALICGAKLIFAVEVKTGSLLPKRKILLSKTFSCKIQLLTFFKTLLWRDCRYPVQGTTGFDPRKIDFIIRKVSFVILNYCNESLK
jgi:hypothetical protein